MDDDEWTENATEAITLRVGKETFSPTFTYPIFGDEELVYGFQGLKIEISFDSQSLLPCVKVSYDKIKPGLDVKKALEPLLKEMSDETVLVLDGKDTVEALAERERHHSLKDKVPGQLVDTFADREGHNYNLYRVVFDEENTKNDSKAYLLRFQIFALFFIEAGSYIDIDDRWELFVVYDNDTFVGFALVYSYLYYNNAAFYQSHTENIGDSDGLWWPQRKKISQFVVLPSHQGLGVGAGLYSSLFNRFYAEKNVYQIVVEDPSEQFDSLRDRVDMQRLFGSKLFDAVVSLKLSPHWMEQHRAKQKMDPRQFVRCVEMGLLELLDANHLPKEYRLLVKRRLYIRNREALDEMKLGPQERRSKIQETFEGVIKDYQRILQPLKLQASKKRVFEK